MRYYLSTGERTCRMSRAQNQAGDGTNGADPEFPALVQTGPLVDILDRDLG
jgi:hypothetical protein